MGTKALSWVFENPMSTPEEQAVMIVMANYCDSENMTTVTPQRIAFETALSPESVAAAMDRLYNKGWIAMGFATKEDGRLDVRYARITLNIDDVAERVK